MIVTGIVSGGSFRCRFRLSEVAAVNATLTVVSFAGCRLEKFCRPGVGEDSAAALQIASGGLAAATCMTEIFSTKF